MSVCHLCSIDLNLSIPFESYQWVYSIGGHKIYFCMNCPMNCRECDNDFGFSDNQPGTDFCTECFLHEIQPSSFGG